MKEGIHPNYREVVFQDMSSDFKFITRSTIQTKEMITLDGKEYPLAKIEVSSESHPFYTGQQKVLDTAGRVEKFRQKFGSSEGRRAVTPAPIDRYQNSCLARVAGNTSGWNISVKIARTPQSPRRPRQGGR